MRRLLLAALAVALLAGRVVAATAYPGVADTSVETPTSRVMALSVLVKAPRATLWKAFLDPAELRRWNVPVSFLDLRPGGIWEASYDPAAKPGDPQNIKNEIVALDVGRSMAFRNVQAPKGLPGRDRFGRIVTSVLFEDAGPGATRVTLWQVGYGGGDEDKPLFAFFRSGNAYLLSNLNHVYAGGPKPEEPDGH